MSDRPKSMHSHCDTCRDPVTITLTSDEQRWSDVDWEHDSAAPPGDPHEAEPELRYAIDADCPSCQWPEVGYSPDREEFACSRCRWSGKERPGAGITGSEAAS